MSEINASISIFRMLNVTAVTSLLAGGGVYRYNRPINSRQRDVVISTPEPGKVDINIHVPNLNVQDDQTVPDTATMKTITDAILSILSGYDFERGGMPQRDSDGQWFCQIRIAYEDISGIGVSAELFTLSRTADGYGGYNASRSSSWQGLARRVDTKRGSQASVDAGRFELNMQTDWLLPIEAQPEKYMVLDTNEGSYVILGIIPESGGWRINTKRKDGNYSTPTT